MMGVVESDLTLRPRRLEDYVGQGKLKKKLQVSLEAAKNREEALDHLLLFGPPLLLRESERRLTSAIFTLLRI